MTIHCKMQMLETVEIPWNGISIEEFSKAMLDVKKLYDEVFKDFEKSYHISILHTWKGSCHFSVMVSIIVNNKSDLERYYEAKEKGCDMFRVGRLVGADV